MKIIKQISWWRKKIGKFDTGARGGTRTRTIKDQRILSPSCIPFHHPGKINKIFNFSI